MGRSTGEVNGNRLSVLTWEMPWIEELVGYSPWGQKELDATEWLSAMHHHTEIRILLLECKHTTYIVRINYPSVLSPSFIFSFLSINGHLKCRQRWSRRSSVRKTWPSPAKRSQPSTGNLCEQRWSNDEIGLNKG